MTDISTKRREALFSKLLDKDITTAEARRLTRSEWNAKLGTNIKKEASFKAQKRLLDQIDKHIDEIVKEQERRIERERKYLEKAKEADKADVSRYGVKQPKTESEYGIIEIEVIEGDCTNRWIRYNNIKSLQKSVNKIIAKYNISAFNIIFHGTFPYQEYVDSQFLEAMELEL